MGRPRWSADGARVLFLRDQDPSSPTRHPARLRSLDVASGAVRGPWPASDFTAPGPRLYLSVPRKVQILDTRTGKLRTIRDDPPVEDDFGGEIYADPAVSADERWILVSVSSPGGSAILLGDTTTGAWTTPFFTKH